MAIVLWLLLYGYCSMAIVLWLLVHGYLWLSFCGYRLMAAIVWPRGPMFQYCAVMYVVLKSSTVLCGNSESPAGDPDRVRARASGLDATVRVLLHPLYRATTAVVCCCIILLARLLCSFNLLHYHAHTALLYRDPASSSYDAPYHPVQY